MATRGARHVVNNGKVWTLEEIEADCSEAQGLFRLRRMGEPLEEYLAQFTASETAAEHVIDNLAEILQIPPNQELLAEIVANQSWLTALRYLTAPPVSEDDLDTLLTKKLSATALRRDEALARALVEVLKQTIDPKRFPWISREEGVPDQVATKEQLSAAKLATAVAATIQRVQTNRRTGEKNDLEDAIERTLDAIGFQKKPRPSTAIQRSVDLPAAGEYMREVTVGTDNGDFAIGLYDGRHLILECKSSNSGINSRKRLNKEVVKNVNNWVAGFGNQIIGGAALRGVFNPYLVFEAQSPQPPGSPILIFWGHRLKDLEDFIESTRPS